MRGFCAASLCALALAGSAGATTFGVAEDAGKYADDGGATVFGELVELGMTENRVAIFWDATRPTTIVEKDFLDRSLPQADKRGIRIAFSVMPLRPTGLTASPAAPAQFAAFLKLLARRYPQVRDYIVGNEPNQPRFWRPQFVGRRPVSGAAYERVLALSYDALKSVDPSLRVIGLGLSPRGNDNPAASSNVSTSPVRFIRDVGAAYRASARARPIMDALAFHPYPNPSSAADPISRGYRWPNAGFVNLDRIKQAVWDAFAGTGQPTFAETGRTATRPGALPGPAAPLTLVLDETGWQAAIPASSAHAYEGHEQSQTVSEASQAQIYAELVRRSACDAAIDTLNFFHLVDESDLDRFQSGLIRADGTRRPSFVTVKAAIGFVRLRGCPIGRVSWTHTTDVVGASVRLGRNRAPVVSADEDASYRVELVPNDGSAVAAMAGTLRAGWSETPRVRAFVRPGRYAYRVEFRAALNPERTTTLVSAPFQLG